MVVHNPPHISASFFRVVLVWSLGVYTAYLIRNWINDVFFPLKSPAVHERICVKSLTQMFCGLSSYSYCLYDDCAVRYLGMPQTWQLGGGHFMSPQLDTKVSSFSHSSGRFFLSRIAQSCKLCFGVCSMWSQLHRAVCAYNACIA